MREPFLQLYGYRQIRLVAGCVRAVHVSDRAAVLEAQLAVVELGSIRLCRRYLGQLDVRASG